METLVEKVRSFIGSNRKLAIAIGVGALVFLGVLAYFGEAAASENKSVLATTRACSAPGLVEDVWNQPTTEAMRQRFAEYMQVEVCGFSAEPIAVRPLAIVKRIKAAAFDQEVDIIEFIIEGDRDARHYYWAVPSTLGDKLRPLLNGI